MTTKILSLTMLVSLATLFPNLSHGSTNIQENSGVGTELESKSLEIPQRTPTNLAERISRITSLFDRFSESSPETTLNEIKDWGDKALVDNKTTWGRPISTAPHLALRYNPEFDDLLVLSVDLFDSVPKAVDANSPEQLGNTENRDQLHQALQKNIIKQKDAYAIALNEVKKLTSNGILAKSDYDWENVHVSTVEGGFGRDDMEAVRWVDEYTFSFQRTFDGIPIYGAGLRVGIHRTGQISSIRISGMDIDSPSSHPEKYVQSISTENVLQKLKSSIPPGAELVIHREGPFYLVPWGKTEFQSEPKYVFDYSLIFHNKEGPIASRRTVLAYSLTDASVSPVLLTPPAKPEASGDPRERN